MDYASVAGSVVLGVPGVRACLVVSQDGLPIAAFPEAEEAAAAAILSRLASVGQVTRGFVVVRSEVWAFVQGERHGALIVADRSARPGQILDLADRVLAQAAAAEVLAGADRRVDAPGAGRPDARNGPAPRRFRMPLHRDDRPIESEIEPTPVTADVVVSIDAIATGAHMPPAPAPSAPAPKAVVAQGAQEQVASEDRATVEEYHEPMRQERLEAVAATPIGPAVTERVAEPIAEPARATVEEHVAETVTEPAVVEHLAEVAPAPETRIQAPTAEAAPDEPVAGRGSDTPGASDAPAAAHEGDGTHAGPAEGRAGGEVDIIALAREFAGLIFERD